LGVGTHRLRSPLAVAARREDSGDRCEREEEEKISVVDSDKAKGGNLSRDHQVQLPQCDLDSAQLLLPPPCAAT